MQGFIFTYLLYILQTEASQPDFYSVPSDNSLYTLLENMVSISPVCRGSTAIWHVTVVPTTQQLSMSDVSMIVAYHTTFWCSHFTTYTLCSHVRTGSVLCKTSGKLIAVRILGCPHVCRFSSLASLACAFVDVSLGKLHLIDTPLVIDHQLSKP